MVYVSVPASSSAGKGIERTKLTVPHRRVSNQEEWTGDSWTFIFQLENNRGG